MANENKDDRWDSFILIIIIILVVCGNIKSCIDDKKKNKSIPVEVKPNNNNSNNYSNNRNSVVNNNQIPSDNSEPTYTYSYTNKVSIASNVNSSSYNDYEETDDCVDGEVVYEGNDDYYIIETRRGYTICERYSGRLFEGMKVRGELNIYIFRYIINKYNDDEIRIYIEDYALSESEAIEWMRENKHIK